MAAKKHRWRHVGASHAFAPLIAWHQVCDDCGWHKRFTLGTKGGSVPAYRRGDDQMPAMPKCEAQEGAR